MNTEPTRPDGGALHLILMSRAPVAGRTKTRLSPPLSAQAARDFHVACLNDLLAEGRAWRRHRLAAGGAPVELHLFITPPASQPAFRHAGVNWPDDYALHNQRGNTLGERMENAIRRVWKRSRGARGVLLTGTDLPLLGAAQLDEAAAALETAEVVFGPTPDGGYYLVGVRGDPEGLFDVRGWGEGPVLEQSLAAVRRAGKHPALIASLPDVDTVEDLRAIRGHPLAAALVDRSSLRLIAELEGAGGEIPGPCGRLKSARLKNGDAR